MTESSLEERRVLITGGGTGIGRRLALSFAEAGSTIGIAARREEPLAQTVSEIRDHGGRADFHTVDIRKEDRVDRCVDYFWDVFGGIDVLVNNAGANFPSPAASISPNGWRTIIDINLNGTFLMSRAVGKRMMDDGIEGRIINMSATNPGRARPESTTSPRRSLSNGGQWGFERMPFYPGRFGLRRAIGSCGTTTWSSKWRRIFRSGGLRSRLILLPL